MVHAVVNSTGRLQISRASSIFAPYVLLQTNNMLCAGIAWLSNRIGLQKAMLLVPACYFLSGVGFFFAHRIQDAEKQKQLSSSTSNT